MAQLALIATAASAAVTAIGTIASGQAEADLAMKKAAFGKQVGDFEAAQHDIQAKDERAAGQREMLQHRRQKNLALSRLQAVSAGSGFTSTDPTSLSLADEISRYGTYQEQTALYGGESRANELNLTAAAKRHSGNAGVQLAGDYGDARRTASYFSAAGTILGGVSGMADKYAKRTPVKTTGRYG